jgi:Mg-chelatase subunit ChlD
MLVPVGTHNLAWAQRGATFITAQDNENNALTGAPDDDMHSTNPECLFNDNPVTPIEFNIVVQSLPAFTTAQLSLYAWDVDEQGQAGYEPEVDEVYFNGNLVGTLTGWTDTWSTSVFNLDPSWVQQGNNLVQVRVNVRYPNNHETWCTAIEWGQLVLDQGAGVAFVREAALDRDCYVPGDTIGVFVEVDTTQASQEVLVEINILDPNGVTRAATTRTFTTRDADDDSFTASLSLPADAPTGTYTAQVIVYDAGTMAQQDIWTDQFLVDPSCAVVTPVITDTPTPTPSPSPTPTIPPPLPPCPVTCDKTAIPATVNAGEEVEVTLSLTGSNGSCKVTKENVDVVLVIDRSGSMSGQKIADAKAAAKVFVDKMDLTAGADQVGLVAYSSSAVLNQQLSRDAGTVRSAVDGLSAGGGTNITDGINKAQAELESPRRASKNRPVIVLMTDGVHSASLPPPEPAAGAAKGKGTRIFTIGLGGDVNADRLKTLATSASDYYFAPDGAALAGIYEQIAGAIRGQPGTNIKIVDVVAPNWTVVPGSFVGSPAPTLSGNTLTWNVASLGFETKTWKFRVKAPQSPGTYAVNESTEITYTDSTGAAASTNCPSPEVAVVGGVTPPPPLPPCPVTCDKSAIPGTVRAGEEVTVLISLTGSDGTCVIQKSADVMLVIDRSGSMAQQSKLGAAKAAAKVFVDRMDLSPGADQVGLVSYSDSAAVNHQLSRTAGTVRTAIDGLASGGETNITDGINKAQAELDSARRASANRPVIVLMTDGRHTGSYPAPEPAAEAAKGKGTRVFTIGLGGDVNADRLKRLASSQGDYYFAPDSTALAAIYEQIAGAIRGQPGTNINIVDVLAPGWTVVPGSFGGLPAPTVSGNTLTWNVASLGFETKSWSFKVKAPATPGTYAVNQSLTITYIDSTGNLANAGCPSPEVTVIPATQPVAEIYTRDNPADDGSVPSSEPWWESPDIWCRHQADGVERHQNPESGRTNYVYVRVHNIGDVEVTNITVHVHGAKAAAAFRWPQDWQPEIGAASIASLPAGQSAIVNVPWQPPQSGHFCFLSRTEAPEDPIRHDGWVKFDNNISQRNVHVMDLSRKPLDSPVILVNPTLQPKYVDLVVDSSGFPSAGVAYVDLEPGLFQRWQDAGGDLTGAEVVAGTSSIAIRPASELQATIHRIPLRAGEQSEFTLRVEGPPESQAIVRVREIMEGEEVGGNIYQPPVAAFLGDGDGDGLCTEVDALMALRMAVGLDTPDVTTMDVTGDGQVTEVDALQILKWAVRGGQCGG